MKWQERTISQVMATRRRERGRAVTEERPGRSRMEEEAGGVLRRSEHGEDVGDAMRYLERKCRVSFSEAFGIEHFQWRVAPPGQSLELQQHYDPAQRSYYLFSGQVASQPSPSASLHTTQPLPSPREATTLQAQCGLGWLFSQQSLRNTRLTLLSGTALQITHPAQSHRWIQRSCLMTLREKQQAVTRMPLFSPIENLSRAHLPHFSARKYVKGEKVYLIGEPAQELYLVIEGEIAFQSLVAHSGEEESPLRKALLRRTGTVVTQTIGKGNYFGQEQILAETARVQNAKCLSIQALILIIPRPRLQRLVACSQFKRTLQLSASLKQEAREHQLSTLLSFTKKKEEPLTPSPEVVQKFSQIKSAIYTHLLTGKASAPYKGRLNRGKKKVVHNHSMTAAQVLSTPIKASPFSMLNVNKAMYDKTLMRFRYHLKEIQRSAQGTPPPEVPRGRSLQDIWRTLKLQKSFNPEEERMRISDQDGMASYLSHLRMNRHLRETRCFRPKSLHCGNKLKSEYIEYLQMAL